MGKQKVIKTGNSLAVTIPSFFVQAVGIKPGDEVKVFPDPEKGKITYSFSGCRQLSLVKNFSKKK
ncbi:MAG: AbrB/MazE/SpoVT family DNA-binding domain-containing protein [Microgenomates group bacterium]